MQWAIPDRLFNIVILIPVPLDDHIYYRLRIVDQDGSSAYSMIGSVHVGTSGIILNNLYPNPVTDDLIVEWNGTTSMKTQVFFRDVNGRLLQTNAVTTVLGYNQLPLNTSQLSSENYFLSLEIEKDNLVEVFLRGLYISAT